MLKTLRQIETKTNLHWDRYAWRGPTAWTQIRTFCTYHHTLCYPDTSRPKRFKVFPIKRLKYTKKKNNAIEKFYLKHDGSSSNATPLLFATTTFICDRIWSLYTDRVGLLSERVVSTDRSLGRGGSRVDLIWWLVLGVLRRNRRRCRSLVTHTYHLF